MRGQGGAVVYEGPSLLDGGSPVAVILTWQTANEKTGPMVQAWILRTDVPPTEALKSGDDKAICGSCERRGKSCYVQVQNAPTSVYKTLPHYPRLSLGDAAKRLSGQRLRIGAYGDPAAVPASVWTALTRHVVGHTGYTHSPNAALRKLVMASADSPEAAARWQAKGFRTFRVRRVAKDGTAEPLLAGEIACPASSEAGKKTACAYCGLCNGKRGTTDKRKNIAIIDHAAHAAKRRLKVFAA